MPKPIKEYYLPTYAQHFDITKTVYSGKTKYQTVKIVENKELGKIFLLDDMVQLSQKGEAAYHEAMVHPWMNFHGNVKNILIVGGSDGGVLRECVKYTSIEQITLNDIDGELIEICKKHLKETSNGAYNDPRVELVIEDGRTFIKKTKNKFDLIIIDSTDPIDEGPAGPLFKESFYKNCMEKLTRQGILVRQNGTLLQHRFPDTMKQFYKFFPAVTMCHFPLMDAIGGTFTMVAAGNKKNLFTISSEELNKRFSKSKIKTQWYTPETHTAWFTLSPAIQSMVPSVSGKNRKNKR